MDVTQIQGINNVNNIVQLVFGFLGRIAITLSLTRQLGFNLNLSR